MERRQFFRKAIPAGVVLPSLVNGFAIKAFANASPLLQQLLLPVTNTNHVLVLVQLTGGNDGLNTVIPIEFYSNYNSARGNIAIAEKDCLALAGTQRIALHPSLKGLQALYNEGKMKIVQSVGYPNPSFSHFRATDIWMSASDTNQVINSGWVGRYLNFEYPNFPNGYPNATMTDPLSIQIGSVTSLTLQGPSVSMGMSISNPTSFYNLVNGVQDPVPNTNAGKELSYIRTVSQQTQQYATVVKNAANKVTQQAPYPSNNTLADQLKIVAKLIKGGLSTRVYMVNFGSFDTHATQVNASDTTTGTHANLLTKVSEAIKAFQDDLEFLKVDDRVIGMTFSEFGRRIKSNASGGTDHGAAAPLFVFGTNVLPGILGNTPTINSNVTVNDNLPFQYDFRSVYASILNNWLCVDDQYLQQIMLKNYQQLPIVNGIGCNKPIPNTSGIRLISNYPNPFTHTTHIKFYTQGGHTMIQVLDTSGRLVKVVLEKVYSQAGTYVIAFDATALPDGVYYARLQNMTEQQICVMQKLS